MTKSGQHVYVLAYPDCIEYEVMLAAELSNRHNDVKVLTPSGKPHRGSSGFQITPDGDFSSPDLGKCAGLLIPGGDPYELIEGPSNQVMNRLLTQAMEQSIVIGAICAGPAVLGKHGLLKGKSFTHGYGDAHQETLAPFWEGANFCDSDVEIDGNIITAKPAAHVEFATHFALMTGSLESEEKRQMLEKYYRNIS